MFYIYITDERTRSVRGRAASPKNTQLVNGEVAVECLLGPKPFMPIGSVRTKIGPHFQRVVWKFHWDFGWFGFIFIKGNGQVKIQGTFPRGKYPMMKQIHTVAVLQESKSMELWSFVWWTRTVCKREMFGGNMLSSTGAGDQVSPVTGRGSWEAGLWRACGLHPAHL